MVTDEPSNSGGSPSSPPVPNAVHQPPKDWILPPYADDAPCCTMFPCVVT